MILSVRPIVLLFVLAFAGTSHAAVDATAAERARAIEKAAALLETQYVDPALGTRLAAFLRERLARGDVRDGNEAAFAKRLTDDLRAFAGDGHLAVQYEPRPQPDMTPAAAAAFEKQEAERYYGAVLNFGFRRVEWLEGNIGLLTLDKFAQVDMGGDTAVAAMRYLAHTRALIIDLRRNGGGDGSMANLLSAYLFDGGGQSLSGTYTRADDAIAQQRVQAYVPGPRYGQEKPVYVLVSRRTFSAAEAFAYDLRALERVTLVGETTGGGANPFEYAALTPHFVLWLPNARSVNPITGGNWQDVGVKPDVQVPADQALDKALALIRASSPGR